MPILNSMRLMELPYSCLFLLEGPCRKDKAGPKSTREDFTKSKACKAAVHERSVLVPNIS